MKAVCLRAGGSSTSANFQAKQQYHATNDVLACGWVMGLAFPLPLRNLDGCKITPTSFPSTHEPDPTRHNAVASTLHSGGPHADCQPQRASSVVCLENAPPGVLRGAGWLRHPTL